MDIQTLFDTEKKLDKYLAINQYNYASKNTLKNIEKESYKRLLRTSKSVKRSNKNLRGTSDFTQLCLQKKASVQAHYAQDIHKRYSQKYPHLCVEDVFFEANAGFIPFSTHRLDAKTHITYAITLWILDELTHSNQIDEVIKYLPEMPEEFDQNIPEIEDACHDNEIIRRLMYVIANRNEETGKTRTKDFFINDSTIQFASTRCYTSVELYEGITNRERFDSIMALIDKENISRAVKRFEEKMWESLTLCLDLMDDLRTDELHMLEKTKAAVCKAISKCNNRYNAANTFIPYANHMQSDSLKQDPVFSQAKVAKKPVASEYLGDTDNYDIDIYEGFIALEGINIRRNIIQISMLSTVGINGMVKKGMTSEEKVRPFAEFTVPDPYETLFAYLYLLDTGSELPWLTNQVFFVLETAIKKLPWNYSYDCVTRQTNTVLVNKINEDDSDISGDDLDEISDEIESEFDEDEYYEGETDEDAFVVQEEDYSLYSREYSIVLRSNNAEHDGNNFSTKINLPQMIFMQTGCVVPRYKWTCKESVFDLEGNILEPKEEKMLERYTSFIHVQDIKQYERSLLDSDYEDADEDMDDFQNETAEEDDECKDTVVEASVHKQEIERLKGEIHTLHKDRNVYRKRSEKLSEENEALKRELLKIKELLNGSAEEPEDREAKEIEYPYTTKNKFVVFGGHTSWINGIKPLFANIRFIDKESSQVSSIISGCDAVWVQSNAIGHAFYYKILEFTRTHKIPLMYFRYAGVEKCAEQIVNYDKALGKGGAK